MSSATSKFVRPGNSNFNFDFSEEEDAEHNKFVKDWEEMADKKKKKRIKIPNKYSGEKRRRTDDNETVIVGENNQGIMGWSKKGMEEFTKIVNSVVDDRKHRGDMFDDEIDKAIDTLLEKRGCRVRKKSVVDEDSEPKYEVHMDFPFSDSELVGV